MGEGSETPQRGVSQTPVDIVLVALMEERTYCPLKACRTPAAGQGKPPDRPQTAQTGRTAPADASVLSKNGGQPAAHQTIITQKNPPAGKQPELWYSTRPAEGEPLNPQHLNETQQKHTNKCKHAHQRYRTLKTAAAEASHTLTRRLQAAADAGITRYRLAQEIGLTNQAVSARIGQPKKEDRPDTS